jgi:cobaltochelatase CobN
MHRLAATPGGWTPDTEGVIFVEQTPAPLVFLTAADTDIQSLSRAAFPVDFPGCGWPVCSSSSSSCYRYLRDDVLRHAQLIVVRLLGGRAYWPYGLEVVREVAAETGAALIVLPGDDRPAPDYQPLDGAAAGRQPTVRYLTEGGVDNMANGLMWLCDRVLNTTYHPPRPPTRSQSRHLSLPIPPSPHPPRF